MKYKIQLQICYVIPAVPDLITLNYFKYHYIVIINSFTITYLSKLVENLKL